MVRIRLGAVGSPGTSGSGPSGAGQEPRRLLLGVDAWQVLVEALAGLTLPEPLRAQDGPVLSEAQRQVAAAALRQAGVLVGEAGGPGRHASQDRGLSGRDLVAALHPSVLASVTVQARPAVVVDTILAWRTADGLPAHTVGRHVLDETLASGLVRSTDQRPEGRWSGPVELATLLTRDLPAEVVRLLTLAGPGGSSGRAGRSVLRLDGTAAVAAERALSRGAVESARVLANEGGALDGGLWAAWLPVLAGPLKVAQIVLSRAPSVSGGATVREVLLVLLTGSGWWRASTSPPPGADPVPGDPDRDVVLTPLDADVLVTVLAGAVSLALTVGAVGQDDGGEGGV